MTPANAATVEKLAIEHGGPDSVRAVETGSGLLVFRKPKRAEFKRACSAGALFAMQALTFPDAVESLARATNIHPGPERFDEILDVDPAVFMMAAPILLELAGIQSAAEKKG